MRRLLDTPAVQKDANLYATLVQRLGLLTAPTHESMAYLRDVERSAAGRGDAELGRATRTLLDLMGDEDSYVAATAIDAHLGRSMDAKEVDAFAAHVRSSATSPGADTPLVAAILRHADTNPSAVRSVLESLLARAPENSEQASRLRTALASLPS